MLKGSKSGQCYQKKCILRLTCLCPNVFTFNVYKCGTPPHTLSLSYTGIMRKKQLLWPGALWSSEGKRTGPHS